MGDMAKTDPQKPVHKVSRIKIKKKAWYVILAPKVFALKEVGESYLTGPESAMGRVMKISLKELTGNVKDQNAYVSFKITGVQGNKLATSVLGYSLTPAHIRRVVKKNTNRIDNYFVLHTAQQQKVVIKTLMVTAHKTKHSIRTNLSKQLRESLLAEFSQLDFNTIINNAVYQKLQQPLRKQLSKIYPLRELAIKSMMLVKGDGSKMAAVSGEREKPREDNTRVGQELQEESQEEASADEADSVGEEAEELSDEGAAEDASEETPEEETPSPA